MDALKNRTKDPNSGAFEEDKSSIRETVGGGRSKRKYWPIFKSQTKHQGHMKKRFLLLFLFLCVALFFSFYILFFSASSRPSPSLSPSSFFSNNKFKFFSFKFNMNPASMYYRDRESTLKQRTQSINDTKKHFSQVSDVRRVFKMQTTIARAKRSKISNPQS